MQLDQEAIQRINEIGIALSKESRISVLLEKILLGSKELTGADGGTIYMITPQKTIHFEIAMSTSLGFHVGGTSSLPVPFKDLPLFLPDGTPNDRLMVAYAVNHKTTVHVKDAYHTDFLGTRDFDQKTGYLTRSVLTIPIKNHEGDVISGMQLINPQNIEGFTDAEIQLAESLASQAGIVLTNKLLIQNLRKLFESLIRVIAEAIDEKSPSTGNHSKRVPILADLLAAAINEVEEGPLKDIHFSPAELYELKIASFLHDCGKITTPIHIIEKKTKLETCWDRIELIKLRYQAFIEQMKNEVNLQKLHWFELHYPREFGTSHEAFSRFEANFQENFRHIEEEKKWLENINQAKEPITQEALEKLNQIAMTRSVGDMSLLTPQELNHLSIPRGNLTESERALIENHVVVTYRMLSQLDFPKELRRVPEIAASHHERVDGKGYPRGLKKDEIPLQARILIVADVFESLSAPDRSYRDAIPLSQVFDLMQKMVDEGHLDPDVYEAFIKKKAYLPYARQYLTPDQIDTD